MHRGGGAHLAGSCHGPAGGQPRACKRLEARIGHGDLGGLGGRGWQEPQSPDEHGEQTPRHALSVHIQLCRGEGGAQERSWLLPGDGALE
ncbi:hypothetical protein DB31_0390 [Hyalangium minutum]|uniref:Uncharacterized protein n=1 Tax=Hyalangium minutum TaxID=394096 RepID=A0A085WWR6_9BACT|nr:hypothetical protein DB31_0390 [Hyalangium minutum]